jgi:DNA-binding CsgD family transcriptional regulator
MKLMRHFSKTLFLLFFIILSRLSWKSMGQNIEKYCKTVLTNFSYKDYKGYRQNWEIAQNPNNKFMYFANSKGLLEYDGASWRLYELPTKKTVRTVFIDKKGKIYTGALGEFGYWQKDINGGLKYHSLNQLVKENIFKQEEIWNIIETPEGILFQSFAYMFLYDGAKIEKIQTPGNIFFVFEANKKYYVNVIDKGLFEYKNRQFSMLPNGEFLKKESVTTILPSQRNGSILIGTQKRLFIYDGKNFTPFNQILNNYLTINQLNSGLKLANGNYVFGTILNGFIITQPDGKIIGEYNKKSNLQNNTVLSLNTDLEGNVWAGLDVGISLLPLSSPFKFFEDSNGERGTVFDAEIFENKLFLATNHGVYFLDLLKNEKKFNLLQATQGYTLDLEIIDKELVCGHNKGTFSLKNNVATLISNITGGANIIPFSNHPNLFLQGTYTSLCMYEKSLTGNLKFLRKLDGFAEPVKQIIEVGKNKFLLLTLNNGLLLISVSDDLKKVVSNERINQSTDVRNIIKIKNEVWVCTRETLRIYDYKTKTLQKNEKLESFGNGIKKIFDLKKMGLWFLKDDLSLGQIKNGQWKDIPINKDTWVLDSENVLLLDSTIFFCKENGFEVINQHEFLDLFSPKNVQNSFVRSISFGKNKENLIMYDLPNEGNLSLKYNQNNLKFTFCLPQFSTQNHFRYKLENFSEEWSDYTDFAEKEFINLPPNEYNLHLKSENSPEITNFKFTINPPWYWNLWSKIIFLVFIGLLISLMYHLHLKKLEQQNLQFLTEKESQFNAQEEKNRQKIIRLRNEQLENDVIRKTEELADSTIKLIKKNELLKQIKEDVEKINTSKSNTHILKLIDTNLNSGHDWQLFEKNFNKIHEDFFKKLLHDYPELSQGDIKLCAYLKMNLSSKEISQLLNITPRSVELKRYRVRQKLKLPTDTNLSVWLMNV